MCLSPVAVSEKKIVLIIPAALTAHHAPPLYHITAPRVLHAKLSYHYVHFRKFLNWKFLRNVVDTLHF